MPESLVLTPGQKAIVRAIVDKHLPHIRVLVFGSRAQSAAKPFSDLDLLVLGGALDSLLRGDIEEAFDESDLPFRVDITEAASLSSVFLARIKAEAVELT